jgi:hypothetical protein
MLLLVAPATISVSVVKAQTPSAEKAAPASDSDEQGFVAMFDGKSLAGWTVMPHKHIKAWTVKNGVIHGDGDKGLSYLVYDRNKEIADFEMKLRYRFPKGKGNSGVNLRAIKDATGKRQFQSYHVDFGHVGIGSDVLGAWDFHTPGRKEHGATRGTQVIIDEHDRASVTKLKDAIGLSEIRRRTWNDVNIVAKGNTFSYYINGKLSSKFIEHVPMNKRLHRGMIQLQLHDPGMIVEFDRLKIKILK